MSSPLLAPLSAPPHIFTLLIFFHYCLCGRFFQLLYLIYYFYSYSYPSVMFSLSLVLFIFFSVSFCLTLTCCPSVHRHVGCMVPQWLFSILLSVLVLPAFNLKIKSHRLLYSPQGKLLFFLSLSFHFFMFILNKVAVEPTLGIWLRKFLPEFR